MSPLQLFISTANTMNAVGPGVPGTGVRLRPAGRWRGLLLLSMAAMAVCLPCPMAQATEPLFLRGDANGDQMIDIQVSPGRRGIQPELEIQYRSRTAGVMNGWLGLGWGMRDRCVMIETRWGVPRYDPALETETYLLEGEQLTPVAHRGAFQPRTAEKVYQKRRSASGRR